jgi:hypothetical protein
MLVRNVFPLKPLVILPLYFVLSIPCDAQKGYFLKSGDPWFICMGQFVDDVIGSLTVDCYQFRKTTISLIALL